MKPLPWLALFALVNATPEIRYFHYQRPLPIPPARSGQSCVSIPAEIFAHAAPSLADLRLYANTAETPYVLRIAPSATIAPELQTSMSPLNLGQQHGQSTFDAELPKTNYSDVQLNITAQNFIATATVSGSQTPSGGASTKLGSFTVFDLSSQKLGRSTILHLPESNFSYLHFQISSPIKPENIAGLTINHLTEVKPQFTSIAESTRSVAKNRASIFEFTLPANVPIDRVLFIPGPQPINFSRGVDIDIAPAIQPSNHDDGAGSADHLSSGNILRIHTTQNGHQIDEEHLAIDLVGTPSAATALVTVTIHNGDDQPLNLQSVQLQMRQRSLCFEATPGSSYTLDYGDPALAAPQYDYASLFTPQADAIQPSAGQETSNPQYSSRSDTRPFTERYPALLWGALIAVVALLGAIAFRSGNSLKT